jgi:hypothetical protein
MEYFILKPDGEQTGTYSIEQIRAMLNTGFIGPDTRYWHEGINEWQPIDRIEESLNFPEPGADEPHASPPPPQKLSGSLARAIPSPYQQKRTTGPTVNVTTPVPEKTPAAPIIPEAPRRVLEIPTESDLRDPEDLFDPLPDVRPDAESSLAGPAPTAKRLDRAPRRPLPLGTLLYAGTTTLLVVAIIVAIILSRHPARSPLSRVTLTSGNDYVLLDQTAIKSFEDEMRNSAAVDSLRQQIGTSTDPVLIQRININLEKMTQEHAAEVTQDYIRTGRAQIVPPGTYDATAYFDDAGVLTPTRPGLPWVALTVNGRIVYAYLGSELKLPGL